MKEGEGERGREREEGRERERVKGCYLVMVTYCYILNPQKIEVVHCT